jgi:phosphoribosyl 1,2-cyclic phosphodiesterase
MKVRFWGVRGSIAVPGRGTAGYGGNTTCIEVRGDDGTLVVLDAGTGIFPLAQSLLAQMPVQANIFISHSHWDHIQGLPFFTPLYILGNSVRIHGAFDVVSGRGIEQVLDVQLQYSYFPIREAEMLASIDYQTLNVGVPVSIGSLTITPLLLNHPVVNFGYRIDGDGRSMFFTGDHEPWYNIYAPEDEGYDEYAEMVAAQHAQLDAALAGVNLLIADSSYTQAEYLAKAGWGHGVMEDHLVWAHRLGVDTLVCTHHEPTRSDAALEKIFADSLASCSYAPGEQGAPMVLLAKEGLEVVV